jgi:hypothetical protein
MLTKIDEYLKGGVPEAEKQEPAVIAVVDPPKMIADSHSLPNVDQYKVQMLDLTAALGYMAEHEISRQKHIEGEEFTALKSFIQLLSKVSVSSTLLYSYFDALRFS